MSVLFVSCSKDDDEENENVLNASSIVGHWKSIYIEDYDYETMDFIGEFEDSRAELEFKLYDDGTCLYGFNYNGTYKLLGKELDFFITYPKTEFLDESQATYNFSIEEFSHDKMKVKDLYVHKFPKYDELGYPIYDDFGHPLYDRYYRVYTMQKVN